MNLVAAPMRGNHYGDHVAAESHLVVAPVFLHCNKGRPDGRKSSHTEMVTVENIIPAITTNGHRQSAVAHTITSEGHDASEDGTGKGIPLICFDETQITSPGNYSNPQPGDPCHPIARDARPPSIAGSMGVRRLTPREVERCFGFEDDYTAFDAAGKSISDSARYRMLGNSIGVPITEWIGRRIMEAP